ncbi:MAG: hypothetical protein ACI843_001577 [Psychrobacter glaciei]|jgi:hypothetical protein
MEKRGAGQMNDELLSAIQNTRDYGFAVDDVVPIEGRLLNNARLFELHTRLIEVFGKLDIEILNGRCVTVSFEAMPLVREVFKVEPILTIGWLTSEDKVKFYKSPEEIRNLILNGSNGELFGMHVWITLPTMEVLDFTFATSCGVVQSDESLIGQIIAGHMDELIGMSFHPSLVGDDVLMNSNLLS